MPTGLRWERSDSGRIFRRFERSTGETVVVHAPINFYEDFLGGVVGTGHVVPDGLGLALGSTPGTGAYTANGVNGTFKLTSGAASGTYSADGVMLNFPQLNFTPSTLYDLNLEVKLKMLSAVTTATMGVGFTDVASATGSMEEPSSIATATLTTNATDGFGVIYDTGATSAKFHVWGVANDVDSVFYNTGVAPVAATNNIIRLQISNGLVGKAWIDGVLVKEQSAVVTTAIPLTPYVYVNSTTTTARAIEIDYIRVWAAR